ncbi:hypothetical protein N7645_15165 [Pseudomonas juntendi]|uniref:hypothetical protein n=1 Tax=Pseudomonas TaxID=286 RepID=UPI0012ADD7A3|nr:MULTISPECIES: hypothetical protein [Pseudomonas]MDG9918228.1 hypothetical protein [Pseudomonas juntendi]MDH0507676.1 hypothetical protein [Pseudomonas juntendi]MDH1044842.1 hypothetical protein [Pseudomonas juntendi]MRT62344.1 hypothetical protein [Pseudomonas sp. CAH-1]
MGEDEEQQVIALHDYLNDRIPSRDIRGLTLAELLQQPARGEGLLGSRTPVDEVSPGSRILAVWSYTGLPVEVCRALIDVYGNLDWLFELECWKELLTCISFGGLTTRDEFWREVLSTARLMIDPVLQGEVAKLLGGLPIGAMRNVERRDMQYLISNGWLRRTQTGGVVWH